MTSPRQSGWPWRRLATRAGRLADLKPLARLGMGIRRLFRRPEETERLKGWPGTLAVFVLVFAGGMLLISVFGQQGLMAYFRLKGETARLQGEVLALTERRLELSREIEALRNDPAAIELVARKRLGLVRPGEILIQLPPSGEGLP